MFDENHEEMILGRGLHTFGIVGKTLASAAWNENARASRRERDKRCIRLPADRRVNGKRGKKSGWSVGRDLYGICYARGN